MRCTHFEAKRCQSCTLITLPYPQQIRTKQQASAELLAPHISPDAWDTPCLSPESGFRNKAKLVVSGRPGDPILGIVDDEARGIDLRSCGLYENGMRQVFDLVRDFMAFHRLIPYDIAKARGEVKGVIITQAPGGGVMVRFVLRSDQHLSAIKKGLPMLLRSLPRLLVVSVNYLPEHVALVEGDQEVVLTERGALPMQLNGITLFLRPQSFFQTNTAVAQELYATARDWINALAPASLWDLYCGVGGFALHAASPDRHVTGIELSAPAIASAQRSVQRLKGIPRENIQFIAEDTTTFVSSRPAPDLVVVNPPRRGIGARLATWLDDSTVRNVLYSSCNPQSLAQDLAAMPNFQVTRARMFDMFPQTEHQEVLLHLSRR